MKRILSVFLITCLLLSLCGCEEAPIAETTQPTEANGHANTPLLTRVDMGDRWIEYDYNHLGLPVEIREINERGVLSRRVFTYEEDIRLCRQEYYDGDTLTETVEYLREIPRRSQVVSKSISRLETREDNPMIVEYTYTWDNYGYDIAQIRTYVEGSGEESRVEYIYNEKEQREKVQLFTNDVLELETRFTYDEEGRVLTGTDYDADGNVTGEDFWEYTDTTATIRRGPKATVLTYDESRNLIRKEVWIDGESEPAICNTYTYRWENLPIGYEAYDFIMVQLGLGYGG